MLHSKFKKILSSVTVMALMIMMVPTVKAHAVNISFDEITQTLTVSGNGPMDVTISGYYKRCIRHVKIEYGVTSIGEEAFCDSELRGELTLPDSVTSIGENAFAGCWLGSITIPASVTYIGKGAFNHCKGLYSINVDESNINYKSIDGILFSKDGTQLIKRPQSKERTIENNSYTIPDGVTSIGEEAFAGCENLQSITIPGSVTSIGEWAFAGCKNLQSINIPDSVTSIGDGAFGMVGNGLCRSGCENLQSVTIGNGVTYIGDFAFSDCKKLKSVTYLGTTPPKTSDDKYVNIFFNSPNFDNDLDLFNKGVKVPDGYTGTDFCGRKIKRDSDNDGCCTIA